MIFVNPVIDQNTAVDFYAGNDRSFRELLPLYGALTTERRGTFFASRFVTADEAVPLTRIGTQIDGYLPIVVSSYKDLNDIFISGNERPFIMYEGTHNAEVRGLLNIVSLFLCRDSKTFEFRKHYGEVRKVNNYNEAVIEILKYCDGKEVQHTTEVNNKSVGIMYMCWGEKAKEAIKKSQATLRRLGYSYPIAIVNDKENSIDFEKDIHYLTCDANPFDTSKARNFQFRAGRVKPKLCELSPFDLTLYVDADTKFIQPIHEGFEMLSDYDLLVTEEKLSLNDLYNKKLSGWELNMLERDTTIIELGNDGEQKFINSGVLFFKKSKKTLKLFSDWSKEWLRFQEWDEQLALMRAIDKNRDLKVNRLSVDWNSPHLTAKSIIFHNYGRGEVRVNA